MDWSFYSSDGTSGETVQFWSGPKPDVQMMVDSLNVPGLLNALTYEDGKVRTAAAEGLARIGAVYALHISRGLPGFVARQKEVDRDYDTTGLGALFG